MDFAERYVIALIEEGELGPLERHPFMASLEDTPVRSASSIEQGVEQINFPRHADGSPVRRGPAS